MGSEIERRVLPQRWVVVGVAPEQCAETSGTTKALQGRGRVCSRRFFFDRRRRPAPLLAWAVTAVSRKPELAEQAVATVPDPPVHGGQDWEQFSFGWTVRPATGDR